jgi:DNA-directed RNA polymerase sigma subunit (sigma70/sigma32)
MTNALATIDSYEAFLSAVGRYPRMTAAEEACFARRAADGDVVARTAMIESSLWLVVAAADEHVGRGLDHHDLIQEGALGLIRAVDSFDPTLRPAFSTYAGWWIHVSIRRALAACTPGPARPRWDDVAVDPGDVVDREAVVALHELQPRSRRVLELRYGLSASEPRSRAAIARELGVSPTRVAQIERQALYALRAQLDDAGT